MSIYRPELQNFGSRPYLPLDLSHKDHIANTAMDFAGLGNNITNTQNKTGADSVIRSGGFSDVMLGALDKVSAHQHNASSMSQAALLDPDSANVEDILIAHAQANISLNLTRNVLNRLVQGWRDIINTR